MIKTSKVVSIRRVENGTTRTLSVDKNHTFVTGNGIVTHNCMDEYDAGDPNNLLCMQAAMEGRAFYHALAGEWITPKPGFNIVFTGNTKGKGSDDGRYIGTQVLNDAFLERIAITFEQDFAPAPIELKMVLNWMARENCVNEVFANELVRWADAVRRTFKDGGIDEVISTRRLEHIVSAYGIYGDKKQSVELCLNRFDTLTKQAFSQLFDKIATEEVIPLAPITINDSLNAAQF